MLYRSNRTPVVSAQRLVSSGVSANAARNTEQNAPSSESEPLIGSSKPAPTFGSITAPSGPSAISRLFGPMYDVQTSVLPHRQAVSGGVAASHLKRPRKRTEAREQRASQRNASGSEPTLT